MSRSSHRLCVKGRRPAVFMNSHGHFLPSSSRSPASRGRRSRRIPVPPLSRNPICAAISRSPLSRAASSSSRSVDLPGSIRSHYLFSFCKIIFTKNDFRKPAFPVSPRYLLLFHPAQMDIQKRKWKERGNENRPNLRKKFYSWTEDKENKRWQTTVPYDILSIISDLLPLSDFINFRGVCRHWRSAPSCRSNITELSKKDPWCIFYDFDARDKDMCLFYQCNDRRSCCVQSSWFTRSEMFRVQACCSFLRSAGTQASPLEFRFFPPIHLQHCVWISISGVKSSLPFDRRSRPDAVIVEEVSASSGGFGIPSYARHLGLL
ncbi:hypothetical protein KSP40_PGU022752 [Platanthera guangdongensis]|uniref:F-box domain-containing protein n=1 Tax=Platanthera guangdongensis TaxID=2320717 RepID=A0ABR2MV64_9ASPA